MGAPDTTVRISMFRELVGSRFFSHKRTCVFERGGAREDGIFSCPVALFTSIFLPCSQTNICTLVLPRHASLEHVLTQLECSPPSLLFCTLWQTPEKSGGLQIQHLTYPQHFAAGNRIFELYTVVAKRTIPIDTAVGTHFPGPASPVVKSSPAHTRSTPWQRAEGPSMSGQREMEEESTGRNRGIESRSAFSTT